MKNTIILKPQSSYAAEACSRCCNWSTFSGRFVTSGCLVSFYYIVRLDMWAIDRRLQLRNPSWATFASQVLQITKLSYAQSGKGHEYSPGQEHYHIALYRQDKRQSQISQDDARLRWREKSPISTPCILHWSFSASTGLENSTIPIPLDLCLFLSKITVTSTTFPYFSKAKRRSFSVINRPGRERIQCAGLL